jgi:Hsp70 protein
MTDSLGLSIGMTNLVAARIGRPPVMRRSILTLFDDRAPEVGLPGENPNLNQPGLVLSGFVDRVGDPVPLVAADGSPHSGERVLVEALDAMARTVGGGAPIAIAVPAHWGPATVGALRGALRAKPSLAPNGVPAALIPDSVAALSALQTAPGLPSNGVVVLCDFGGSGTSVTLAAAGSNFDAIGETVRYHDFSGDQIDQALLNHVVAGIAEANDADPAGTAAVGSLARLRDECRQAKERLSAETATVVPAQLPGFNSDIRVTRTELENIISRPLAGLLTAIEEALQRNNIPVASIAAAATVGGGANIPLVTQQLSARLRAPVVTTPRSQLNVAAGAALIADAGLSADAPTGMAAAADAPTSMAAAGWVAGAAGLAATESASDGAASATFRALAWSQDDSPAGEPVPYSGEDYSFDPGATDARPQVAFAHEEEGYEPEPGPLPWYKRPSLLFGAAAAAALLAVGGLAFTLTSTSGNTSPVTETATTVETGPSPIEPATEGAPQTVTVTGPDGRPSTTVVPSPTPSSATTTASPTTTTTTPTTTTTTPTTTTTTTTTTATTTRTTTTTPPPTTTTQPPTTTVAPPITTTAAALVPTTTEP